MEKILIATILKPQGLSGELKCKLENENFDVIKNVTSIYLNEKEIPTRVIKKSYNNGYLYLTLGTINSREKAELVRNFKVYANKEDVIIPEDEYIIDDLVGSVIYSEDNQEIGKIIDIQNYGAGDLIVVMQHKREYMVPFLKDLIIKFVPNNKMVWFNKQLYDEVKVCD